MGQISDIINGWKNYLSSDQEATKRAKKRLSICLKCVDDQGNPNLVDGTYEHLMPDFSLKEVQGKKCKKCGCPASTFSRSKNYTCPLDRW